MLSLSFGGEGFDLFFTLKSQMKVQHGRYLENWYLEAGRDLETPEADTEVGVL